MTATSAAGVPVDDIEQGQRHVRPTMRNRTLLDVLRVLAVGTGIALAPSVHAADEGVQGSAEETVAYDEAVTDGSTDALRGFLERFPTSPLASDVFSRLVSQLTPGPGDDAGPVGIGPDGEPCDPIETDCATADEFFASQDPLRDSLDDFLSAETTIY